MSLQFIIGGSGSGKTRTLYENLIRQSMEEPDGRFFALVPEQFTMQTQKEIVMLHPNHGVMNIDIVSFERLAYRVFEELAIENLAGRIAANSVIPYPPGIPMLLSGENFGDANSPQIGYLRSLQSWDHHFPGFEHETEGTEIIDGVYHVTTKWNVLHLDPERKQ